MNEGDLALRNLTYARFAEIGRAPTAAEIAAAGGRGRAEVMAGWERLHAGHALVLDPATGEIRMAHPFVSPLAGGRAPGTPTRRSSIGSGSPGISGAFLAPSRLLPPDRAEPQLDRPDWPLALASWRIRRRPFRREDDISSARNKEL
jgi:hypothetical protein